jgi:NADH dehydrogenase
MKTLFITGASGFIGRHLLAKIDPKGFDAIYCLSRTGEVPALDLSSHQNIRVIKGDLSDADSYAEPLSSSDTVLHLAAVTGKAKPEEYFHVNAEGTDFLVHQCEKHGVKNFLYVSTIAVKYPDISRYYYAQSKKAGEDTVKTSSLCYSIVKPTIVLGKDGPIWLNLAKLAKAPLPFIFGDGKAKIQPIYVEDLVDILMSVIDNEIFSNETYDLGGPEIMPFEEFIQLIHSEYHARQTSIRHIPMKPFIYLLGSLEKYFCSFLPITTGQLSPFRYNSIIEPNPLHDRHSPGMSSPKEMIRIIVDKEKEELVFNKLYNECKVFCRYLPNMEPSEYIIEKYSDAHRTRNYDSQFRATSFDRFLISLSLRNILCTKLVDSYTRVFSGRSVFRKKLILFLAILETTHPYHEYLDSVDSYSRPKLFAALLMKPLLFGFHLALSTIMLAPLHVAFSAASKFRPSKNPTITEEEA